MKPLVNSLAVKTRPIDESPELLPSVTPEVELVIVIVGLDDGTADRNSMLSMYA
jgi:hypothetical protein